MVIVRGSEAYHKNGPDPWRSWQLQMQQVGILSLHVPNLKTIVAEATLQIKRRIHKALEMGFFLPSRTGVVGGLELKPWHVTRLASNSPKSQVSWFSWPSRGMETLRDLKHSQN